MNLYFMRVASGRVTIHSVSLNANLLCNVTIIGERAFSTGLE